MAAWNRKARAMGPSAVDNEFFIPQKLGIVMDPSVHSAVVVVCAEADLDSTDGPLACYMVVKSIVVVLLTAAFQITLIWMISTITEDMATSITGKIKEFCWMRGEPDSWWWADQVETCAGHDWSWAEDQLAHMKSFHVTNFTSIPIGFVFGLVAIILWTASIFQELASIVNFSGLLFLPNTPGGGAPAAEELELIPVTTAYTTYSAPVTYAQPAAYTTAYAAPMAAASYGGTLVVGQDLNRDGIPDALQQPMQYQGAPGAPGFQMYQGFQPQSFQTYQGIPGSARSADAPVAPSTQLGNTFVNGYWPDPAQEKGQLVSLSCWIKIVVVVVMILRMCVALPLLYVGLKFLCFTTDLKDFVLNSIALAFVLQVDDLAFLILMPRNAQAKTTELDQPIITSAEEDNLIVAFAQAVVHFEMGHNDLFIFFGVIITSALASYWWLYAFVYSMADVMCVLGCQSCPLTWETICSPAGKYAQFLIEA